MNVTTNQLYNGWKQFKISNDRGMQVSVLNFGGIITELIVPDKYGTLENVVLGYQHIEDYKTDPNFFGAIIGRVAGRIQDASFKLNERTYHLDANDGNNCLHSGSAGFHNVLWSGEAFQTNNEAGVKLTYTSPDGDCGFPGSIKVTITYTLNNANQFTIDYAAISDQTTVLTLTNHSYFNLSGNLKETVNQHHVHINSSQFIELDQQLIPTGTKLDVSNTPFDFRQGKQLNDGIKSNFKQNRLAGNGYDHY